MLYNETLYVIPLNVYKKVCSSCVVYTVLFVVFLFICIFVVVFLLFANPQNRWLY